MAATVTGSFNAWSVGPCFVLVGVGGIAGGLAIGWAGTHLLTMLDDSRVEILVTLLIPIVAYLGGEALHVSGVLATVTAGLYFGRYGLKMISPDVRLNASAVWNFVVFLINGLIFILIGLHLRSVVERLGDCPTGQLAGYALAICATVIISRFVWVFPGTYLPRFLSRRVRERDPYPSLEYPTIIGWAGLPGGISMAAALSLPELTDAGAPFPDRDLIFFLTFCVIVATLVGQGLTLPGLVRLLGVEDDGTQQQEEFLARRAAASAALRRIDEMLAAGDVERRDATTLRRRFEHVLAQMPESLDPTEQVGEHLRSHEAMNRDLQMAQREVVLEMGNRGEIGDDTLRVIERELDLEAVRRVI